MDVKAKGTKWLSLVLCLTAGFSLSACSDDDDEGGNGGAGSGVAAQQMPKVADAGIQFPVTQYSWYPSEMETYTYSDGRMTGGNDTGGTRYSISTNPLVLTEQDDDRTITYKKIKVNGSGFITYAEFSDVGSWGSVNWLETSSFTLTYDADGHLVSQSGNYYEDSEFSTWTDNYTWENGNLVRLEEKCWNEDGEMDYSSVYTFAYDNDQWTNSGIYFSPFMGGLMEWDNIWFCSGLLGQTTRLIPTSVTENGGETYNTTAVNYNPDGSVQSIEMQNVSSYGSSYTETYRFGYADYPIQQEQSGYSAAPAKKSPKAVRSMKARWMMRR